MSQIYTESLDFQAVKDAANSTTISPIFLMSNFLDSYVQAHQVTQIAPKPQTENTEQALSNIAGVRSQGMKRTKSGCISKFPQFGHLFTSLTPFFQLAGGAESDVGKSVQLVTIV